MMLLFPRHGNNRRIDRDLSHFKKFENIWKRFINRLSDKCTRCMLYFLKFEAVKASFPKCLKCFGSYFREVEIVRQHFHFQKGFRFPRLAKSFVNGFQISEVEYVIVMFIDSNKWNIWGWLFPWYQKYLKNELHFHEMEKNIDFCYFPSKTGD